MTIRHVGYAIVDKNNCLLREDEFNNLIFFDKKYEVDMYVSHCDLCDTELAPHKPVRVLIDDETDECVK